MKSYEEIGHEIIRINKYTDPSTSVPYYYQINAIRLVTAITDTNRKFEEQINYNFYAMPTITDYQTDPIGYADSMNLYQGFNMNPGNFVNPMGILYKNIIFESYYDEIEKPELRLSTGSLEEIWS